MANGTKTVTRAACAGAAVLFCLPGSALAEAFEAIAVPASVLSPEAGGASLRPVTGPLLVDAVQGPAAPLRRPAIRSLAEAELVLGYHNEDSHPHAPLLLDHGAPEVRMRPAGPALRRR